MPAQDLYASYTGGLTASIVGAFVITPSNTEELPKVTRQIYAGGAGNVAVVWSDGSETTEPVAAGERLDWRIKQVKSSGTTATGLRGYY